MLPELRLERDSTIAIERLKRAENDGEPALATRIELTDDGERLEVRFDCEDPEPRATLRARDAPLWQEEVVELFLAPGSATPSRYFEFEVNPLGALFDALVDTPHGDRRALRVDSAWDCPGLEWSAGVRSDGAGWNARISLPWRALAPDPPEIWRLNLFRIDRPSAGRAEFSAWSPTLVEPADFHRPARFGFLRRVL